MENSNLQRRDFHKLTMAAFGGMVAGTSAIVRIANRPDENWEALSANLYSWFEQWAAAAYFQSIV